MIDFILKREEVSEFAKQLFAMFDLNQNGRLDGGELQNLEAFINESLGLKPLISHRVSVSDILDLDKDGIVTLRDVETYLIKHFTGAESYQTATTKSMYIPQTESSNVVKRTEHQKYVTTIDVSEPRLTKITYRYGMTGQPITSMTSKTIKGAPLTMDTPLVHDHRKMNTTTTTTKTRYRDLSPRGTSSGIRGAWATTTSNDVRTYSPKPQKVTSQFDSSGWNQNGGRTTTTTTTTTTHMKTSTPKLQGVRTTAGYVSRVKTGVKLSIEELFKKYDRDNTGYVNKYELKAMYHELGVRISAAQLDATMTYYDKNRDGKISLDEFRDQVRNHKSSTNTTTTTTTTNQGPKVTKTTTYTSNPTTYTTNKTRKPGGVTTDKQYSVQKTGSGKDQRIITKTVITTRGTKSNMVPIEKRIEEIEQKKNLANKIFENAIEARKGYLKIEDFTSIMNQVHKELDMPLRTYSEDEIDISFKEMDLTQNGTVSKSEFEHFILRAFELGTLK